MPAIFERFIDLNRRLSGGVEPFLPQARENIFLLYEEKVGERVLRADGQVVVDVGGGKSCPFAHFRREGSRTRIVAVDCSEEELRENEDVDEKVVADVTRGLPFPDASVDMIVSRSVLEHLRDVRSFVAEARRALKEGGYFIHLFPCRFAPFAMINRALPHAVSRRLLYSLVPETKGIGGFPAVYRDCYYSATRRVLEDNGFEIEDIITSYYQSPYFAFFLPFYLLSAAYELAVQTLGAKNLCAYLLVVAKKSGSAEDKAPRA